jgi:AcrR family transcriptional regulator
MAATNPDSDNREVILAAAERLMSRKGVGDSSLADIASDAGVSRGTLYYHFRSKEDLILAIAEGHMKALTARFAALAEKGGGLADLLKRLFVELLADTTRSALHIHLMHGVFEGSGNVRSRMEASYADWIALAGRELAPFGLGRKEAEVAARLIVAAIDGLILQKRVAPEGGGVGEGRVASYLADCILNNRTETQRAAQARTRSAT